MSDGKKTTDPASGGGTAPAACTTATCPQQDEIVLVELVEVFTEAGAEKTQPPVGRDQYINLDDQVDTTKAHPEYGRFIQLKARVEWKSGDKTKPLPPKSLYWYTKPDAGNKTGLTGTEKEGFKAAGGQVKLPDMTDAKGWTPVMKVFLSQYGGDKFEVFVTENAAYTDGLKAGTYTVWRQLWYQVTEMKDVNGGKFLLTPGVTGPFETGYKTVFIKFDEKLPRTEATHVGNLVNDAARAAEAVKYFTADNLSPFKCHIMTVDYSEPGSTPLAIDDSAVTTPAYATRFQLLWRHGGGATPWKTTASYAEFGGTVVKAIPDDKITLEADPNRKGYKKVKIDLSFLTPPPTPATPAKIHLGLLVDTPTAWGWGGGSYHLYLCSGLLQDMVQPSDWDSIQRSDCVHEIGHALGLVNLKPAAPGSATWEDTAHPNHCIKPITDCAMWYQSGTNRATTFHLDSAQQGCHDFLRRQDYSRSVLQGHWKD